MFGFFEMKYGDKLDNVKAESGCKSCDAKKRDEKNDQDVAEVKELIDFKMTTDAAYAEVLTNTVHDILTKYFDDDEADAIMTAIFFMSKHVNEINTMMCMDVEDEEDDEC